MSKLIARTHHERLKPEFRIQRRGAAERLLSRSRFPQGVPGWIGFINHPLERKVKIANRRPNIFTVFLFHPLAGHHVRHGDHQSRAVCPAPDRSHHPILKSLAAHPRRQPRLHLFPLIHLSASLGNVHNRTLPTRFPQAVEIMLPSSSVRIGPDSVLNRVNSGVPTRFAELQSSTNPGRWKAPRYNFL